MNNEPANGIQVISRASTILRVLAKNPIGLSLGKISELVELPRSTVQRIVKALEHEGLVAMMDGGRGFKLGTTFGQLVHETQIDIISVMRPHLEQLSKQVNETVVLSSFSSQQTNVIDRIVAERELRVVAALGAVHTLYTAVDGKLLLASLSDKEVVQRIGKKYPKLTEYTKDLKSLLEDLQQTRETGFAIDRNEYIIGISAIGIALDTFMGSYVIAIVTPSCRFDAELANFKATLLAAKEKVLLGLGRTL